MLSRHIEHLSRSAWSPSHMVWCEVTKNKVLIPERLRGVFTMRRYTNPCLPLPYLYLARIIRRIVLAAPAKSCSLDPIPTFLLRKCINSVLYGECTDFQYLTWETWWKLSFIITRAHRELTLTASHAMSVSRANRTEEINRKSTVMRLLMGGRSYRWFVDGLGACVPSLYWGVGRVCSARFTTDKTKRKSDTLHRRPGVRRPITFVVRRCEYPSKLVGGARTNVVIKLHRT